MNFTDVTPPLPAASDSSSFAEGFFKGLGLDVAYCVGAALLSAICGFLGLNSALMVIGGSVLFIGAAQLVVIVPFCVRLWRRSEKNAFKGCITAAAVVALLNAACWGTMAPRF